jgi:uncharacterized protein (DUF433 family)
MVDVVSIDKAVLGGAPVFFGTRVPVSALWDYLEGGDTLDAFLADFPSVTRKQAVTLLEDAKNSVINARSH